MIAIKTFVKKPIPVEAIQLTEENIFEVAKWANSIQPSDKQVTIETTDNFQSICLVIPTKEGNMICSIGDYLIKEPFPTDDRMFYPCKPDMFAKTYQEKL